METVVVVAIWSAAWVAAIAGGSQPLSLGISPSSAVNAARLNSAGIPALRH